MSLENLYHSYWCRPSRAPYQIKWLVLWSAEHQHLLVRFLHSFQVKSSNIMPLSKLDLATSHILPGSKR